MGRGAGKNKRRGKGGSSSEEKSSSPSAAAAPSTTTPKATITTIDTTNANITANDTTTAAKLPNPLTNLLAEVCPYNLVQIQDAELRYHLAKAKEDKVESLCCSIGPSGPARPLNLTVDVACR